MITILAVVGEVHPLLALGIAGHDGSIGVHDRLLEEFVRLLSPDSEPGLVDGVHQGEHVGLGETAAEVPLGGRVRDSLGSQRIEVDLIVAPQFEVFDVLAASEDVEGDVQDMVGFVVGLMPFEHLKVAVDILDEVDFLSQEENGTDAAGTEATDAISVFVVDIAGRHHGYRPLGTGRIVESFLEFAVALPGKISSCVPHVFFGE